MGVLWPTLLGSVASITLEVRPQLFLLTSLKVLISTNASSFRVSGSCSEEGRQVEVSVGGVKTQVDCVDGRLGGYLLDVTGLNKTPGSISITANHSSSDGRSAHIVSKSVTNDFICPENFVGVPSLGDYTTRSFCVSKYEMKNDGSGNGCLSSGGRSLYGCQ